MQTYEYNGKLYKFADGKVPAGAVLHRKAKAEKPVEEKPAEVKTKAKKAPSNKARKAGADK